MKQRFYFAVLSVVSLIGVSFATAAQAEQRCRAHTVDLPNPGRGLSYREVNNCPLIKRGTFQNRDWEVYVSGWETAAYQYRGKNRHDGSSVQIIDFDVRGTTRRPQYNFHRGNVTYRVTYQAADSNTIRLEVFQGGNRILNQLLDRVSNTYRR